MAARTKKIALGWNLLPSTWPDYSEQKLLVEFIMRIFLLFLFVLSTLRSRWT
jgi:hypothetical protein